MLKKMMLLAVSAAALVAFVVPASASAAEWLHEGKAIEAHETIGLTGSAGFESTTIPGAKFECTVHAEVTVKPGSPQTSSVTKFEVTTSSCKGYGALETCKLTNDTSTTPWQVVVNAADFEIKGVEIHNEFASCPVAKTTLNFPAITATPDNPEAISSVTLSGTGTSALGGIKAQGTLNATAPGTYGIG